MPNRYTDFVSQVDSMLPGIIVSGSPSRGCGKGAIAYGGLVIPSATKIFF